MGLIVCAVAGELWVQVKFSTGAMWCGLCGEDIAPTEPGCAHLRVLAILSGGSNHGGTL